MNFNASSFVALALSMGAFLAFASPLPRPVLPDGHKCAGLGNCNTANLGDLVNVENVATGPLGILVAPITGQA
ncbi:hypothetical protein PGT21_029043 [Puccinia graminis f. sp. tritici]|uniref:Hydrophobin n=1 Tax=Puccinia graminis f. sp. tritici TaxID=56615 RepID=A0A5B0PYV0_PUCGR|nr:hypothetical protein PGT21_029043 [Puccinia graminis f. sp. tritici]KAA1109161.1 hypothetical protein PGTUg99_008713 [Puccinia graminis f. sp. tritici]